MVDDARTVVHVVTWLDTGGAQETAARLCAGLCRAGWDTHLIGGAAPRQESPGVEAARATGVAVEAVDWMGRAVRPWDDLITVLRLVRRFRSLRPHVVHTHSSKAGILGRIAAALARVPVRVHTVHGWSFDQDLHGPAREGAIALERLIAGLTDALVVVSAVDRGRGLRAGIGTRARYRLIRSAVPLRRYRPAAAADRAATKEQWGVPRSALVVGTVTRFAPPKDITTLLDAFSLLRRCRPDAHLVVVGDGPERASVEAELVRRRLEPHVTLLGHRGDVAAAMRGFDVFAFSSRREGLPRAVVEAVASGLPVVSTDVGGVAEVLRLAPAAELVAVGDPRSMARALAAAAEWPVGGSASARAAALRGFDEGEMVRAHEALYQSLLDAR